LHVHVFEFGDRDIQVLERLDPTEIRVGVLHQKSGESNMRQCKLGSETDSSCSLQGLRVVPKRRWPVSKEYGGIAQDPCDTRWHVVASAYVSHAFQSTTDRLGRFSVFEDNRELQVQNQVFLTPFVVSRQACVGIQQGSRQRSSFGQPSERSQTQGAWSNGLKWGSSMCCACKFTILIESGEVYCWAPEIQNRADQ